MPVTPPSLKFGDDRVLCSQRKELDGWRPVWISRTPRAVFGWADQHLPERHLELQSPASHHEPQCPPSRWLQRSRNNPVHRPGRGKLQVWTNRTAGHEISRPVLDSCRQQRRKREATGQRNVMRKQWSLVILGQRAVRNRWKREKMRKRKDSLPFAALAGPGNTFPRPLRING